MRGKRSLLVRLAADLRIALVVVALLFIIAQLSLPFLLRHYVNQRLDALEGYRGEVGAIQVNLLRGAYQIHRLRMVKVQGDIPVPFIRISKMDLSLEWDQLFRGALVGEVILEGAEVNFVNGPTEDQKQTGADRGWKQVLEDLFPFQINRFEVKEGVLRYADPHRSPPVDVYMTNLFAVATNLTNVRNKNQELPAGLAAKALAEGGGKLELNLLMNPLAEQPTFKLRASLVDLNLTELNDFLRAYASADAESGRFWVYLNVAAADGQYQGLVKPFFLDLNILEWEEVQQQALLQTFWETLVAGVAELFENQPEGQVATVIPIEGQFEQGASVDLWATIGGILRNAFFSAIKPGVPGPVGLPPERNSPPAEHKG